MAWYTPLPSSDPPSKYNNFITQKIVCVLIVNNNIRFGVQSSAFMR